MEYFQIFISAIFINNIVLTLYLGNCPYVGCSKEQGVAMGMGFAVIFVTIMATVITWVLQIFILTPLNLNYLQTIAFILVIASLVQFIEIFIKKFSPALYKSLGIFLPLITTNCAVLGVAIIVQRENYTFISALVYAISASLGFFLALILLAGIRERLVFCSLPKAMQGVPIGLLLAGIMSLAFMAFKGMV